MFRRSRWKIVAALLSLLMLLLFGTLLVIYLASYADMRAENRQLLTQYVDNYVLSDSQTAEGPGNSEAAPPREQHGPPPRLELQTFYAVAFSKDGTLLQLDTAEVSSLDATALETLAREILLEDKLQGETQRLLYQVADKGNYTLVAFLDNTVMLENAKTLIRYTLLFGAAALVPLFFLARFLAKRIVAPLEESYQRQKQFVSDAGHELKTPVAVISTNLELLSRELGGNPWLSNIQYENERMRGLILQLLELARTETVAPPMETLDFSRLVYGELLPFETVAYEQGLRLAAQVGPGISLFGNAVQLRQLISILLDNAIRHGVQGEEVALRLLTEKGCALLSVVNAGAPIPSEQQAYLFERFYQQDPARSGGEGQHYGLGLAIAKAIVNSHRGRIQVRCYDGKVEFLVRLPLSGRGRKI